MKKFTYEIVLDGDTPHLLTRVAGLLRTMATALESQAAGNGQPVSHPNASKGVNFECIKLIKVEDV